MSFIQNFFTSRDNNANTETYLGQQDRLWYNPDTNSIRISDGVTPGGLPIDLDLGANATFDIATACTVITDTIYANSGTVYGELIINGNISPAANGKIGGITPGPGVNVSESGLLTIDTANLPISFGDFYANNNILSIVNIDEDMILNTEGNAEIQLVGNIGFYKPDGLPPNVANRYFSASSDGQIRISVSNVDPTTGAVEIVGTTSGNSVSTVNTGVMLHITGQNGLPSRIYNDGISNFAAFVGRRINGTAVSPTPVVAGDELIRISSTGYNGTEVSGSGSARIVYQAMENFTTTNTGSNLSFWTAAIGSNVLTKIVTIDTANGLVATLLTATGNVAGGNITTAGRVTANGNVSANNIIASNVAYIGNGATTTSFLNPTIVARNSGATYTQIALVNTSNTGSADYIAYGDNGNDAVAWADMGFTGSNFNDANYTITGKNDGYFIVQSASGAGLGGNLVIATGNLGITNDIIFATGGFLSANEKMRYINATNQFYIKSNTTSTSTTSGAVRVGGGLGVAGNAYVGGLVSVAGTLGVTGNANVGNLGTTQVLATGNITGSNINANLNVVVGNTIRYDIASNNAIVTQLTSKTTPVTANGRTGQITTSNASLPQNSAITFTVNNTVVSSNDVIILNMQSGATQNSYGMEIVRVSTGSFDIQIRNFTNGALTDAIVINFAVIKVS